MEVGEREKGVGRGSVKWEVAGTEAQRLRLLGSFGMPLGISE